MLLYQIINILDASNPSKKLIKVSDSICADTFFLYFLDASIYSISKKITKTSHPRYVPESPCCSPSSGPYLPWQPPAH